MEAYEEGEVVPKFEHNPRIRLRNKLDAHLFREKIAGEGEEYYTGIKTEE